MIHGNFHNPWLVISLIGHYVVIIYLTDPVFMPNIPKHKSSLSVRINFLEAPKAERSESSSDVKSSSHPFASSGVNTDIQDPSARQARIYSKLMPQHSWFRGDSPEVGHQKNDQAKITPQDMSDKTVIGRFYGLQGRRVVPEVEQKLDDFATHIEVPQLWKKKSEEAKSEAVLVIDSSGDVMLESLYGDAFLRAILFQSLMDLDHIEKLYSDLISAKITRYKIILRFLPVRETPRGLGLTIAAFTDGMVITKLLPQVMREFTGIPIEDEEVKRWKRREQVQISKLMESPAYTHPIRDFKIRSQTGMSRN